MAGAKSKPPSKPLSNLAIIETVRQCADTMAWLSHFILPSQKVTVPYPPDELSVNMTLVAVELIDRLSRKPVDLKLVKELRDLTRD